MRAKTKVDAERGRGRNPKSSGRQRPSRRAEPEVDAERDRGRSPKSGGQQRPYQSIWLQILILVVAGVIGGVIMHFLEPLIFPPEAFAQIAYPQVGQSVESPFRVTVKSNHVPQDHHLWLVSGIGDRLWPKVEVKWKNCVWRTEFSEDDNPSDGRFAIRLIEVAAEGNDFIQHWLSSCSESNSYPGLLPEDIPGVNSRHIVDLKLKRAPP